MESRTRSVVSSLALALVEGAEQHHVGAGHLAGQRLALHGAERARRGRGGNGGENGDREQQRQAASEEAKHRW